MLISGQIASIAQATPIKRTDQAPNEHNNVELPHDKVAVQSNVAETKLQVDAVKLDDNIYNCQNIKYVFDSTMNIIELSYKYLSFDLVKYTQHQFRETPNKFLKSWRHRLEQFQQLVLEHPFKEHVFINYTIQPEQEYVKDTLLVPLSKQMLFTVMHNIYATFRFFENTFSQIIVKRNLNKTRLTHELFGNYGDFKAVNEYFQLLKNNANANLCHTEWAMKRLKISKPFDDDLGNTVVTAFGCRTPFCPDPRLREWLLVREYLSVLQLFDVVYKILSEQCALLAE